MSITKALQRPGLWATLVVAAFLFQGVASAQGPVGDDPDKEETLEQIYERQPFDDEFQDLARATSAIDRAFGLIQMAKLEATVWNWVTTNRNYTGVDGERYYHGLAGAARSSDNYYHQHSPALGVEAGPWFATAQVHENTGYIISRYLVEWEAVDGARGNQFADPPLMVYNNPLMASTQFEASLPPSGWPAPQNVTDVWLGTDTWNKFGRTEGVEAYGEFDDSEAGERHPDGEASTLDLSGRIRLIGFGALEAAFYQYEFTNNSTNTYTGVYVGVFARRRQQWSDGNESFPRWDNERQAVYMVGTNYFTPLFGPGSHTDDDDDEAAWCAMLFLESPTGSWKTDALDDTVDSPSTILTRTAFANYSDRVRQGDHEWGQYGAMSGDLSYFDEFQTGEDLWKAQKNGGGSPVLMQDEHHWAFYEYDDWNMTDAYTESNRSSFQYLSAGPVDDWAPGETMDLVYAVVCGINEQNLKDNMDKAIRTYQKQFATSGPPPRNWVFRQVCWQVLKASTSTLRSTTTRSTL